MNRDSQWLQPLASRPDWLCHELDLLVGQANFVRVDAEVYRRSAFLDQRLALGAAPQRRTAPLWTLVDALADHPIPAVNWIFHMGHCGSTLLSRLVEAAAPGMLCLREPLPLLSLASLWRQRDDDLAIIDPDRYPALERAVAALLGRRYAPQTPTLVKATSDCTPLAQRLGALHPESRALGVEVSLERYLQSMLRNDLRRAESMGHSQARLSDLRRLDARFRQVRIYRLSPGQLAAMNWLSLRRWLLKAEREASLVRVDFDDFLASPQSQLADICRHFGVEVDDQRISAVLSSDNATRYAKDATQPFDAETRSVQLAESARQNAEQIRAGLEWVQQHADPAD